MIELPQSPPAQILKKDVFTETISADVLQGGDIWLNAPSYSGEIGHAEEVIARTPYEVIPLDELCEDIWYPARVSRHWVDDAEHGAPYLAPTDLMYFKPQFRVREMPSKSYVRAEAYDDPEQFFADEGDILVTRSGKIGRTVLATETLTDYFLTDDLIRVETADDTLTGYIYAYLDSWIGQAYMKRDEYGGWVDHIEPKPLKKTPIIMLPEEERREIHEQVMTAYRKREEFLQDEAAAVNDLSALLEQDADVEK